MKKIIALALVCIMIMSVTLISAHAQKVDIEGEIAGVVVAEYKDYDIKEEDVYFSYINPLTNGKFLVNYTVAGFNYSCDIVNLDIGKYILVSSRPLPQVYDGGILYSLEKAYKYGILKENDLELMDSFEELDFSKTKISSVLMNAMNLCDDDDYLYIKLELDGTNKELEDFDGWYDDISAAYDKLVVFQESLHDKLINETLKGYDYIDVHHSDGYSVVAIKKRDIEKISQDDFVLYMDHISDVHAQFIKTYTPVLTRYSYKEIAHGYDKDYNENYVLVKISSGVNAQSISFRFGNVIIRSGTVHHEFEYGYAVYDIKEEKFYDIFDIRKTPDKYNKLEEYLTLYCDQDIDLVGDSDYDGKVNVLDATKIQRVVAQLEKLSSRDRYYPLSENGGYLSDVDNDGVVSVLDATSIQLSLID